MCVFACFFFKHKTAYEMRISDWSSDVCSSDLKCERASYGKKECQGQARLFGAFARSQALPGRFGRQRMKPSRSGGAMRWARWVKIGRASCRERVCQYV